MLDTICSAPSSCVGCEEYMPCLFLHLYACTQRHNLLCILISVQAAVLLHLLMLSAWTYRVLPIAQRHSRTWTYRESNMEQDILCLQLL